VDNWLVLRSTSWRVAKPGKRNSVVAMPNRGYKRTDEWHRHRLRGGAGAQIRHLASHKVQKVWQSTRASGDLVKTVQTQSR
jgi:hypothetical protein